MRFRWAPRTIRGRVTAVTALVLTVVLGLIAALVTDQVRRHASRALDDGQGVEVEALASMVRLHEDGLSLDTDGQDALHEFAVPGSGAYYQVTALRREPLRSASLAGAALAAPPAERLGPVPAAFPPEIRRENVAGPHESRLRLVTLRIALPTVRRGEDGARPDAPIEAVVLQVARSRAQLEQMRAAVNRGLAVALPVGLLLGSLGAFLLARRATAPLGRLCDEARAIGSGPTDARLDVSRVEGELRDLAETFNEAIRRLTDVAAREHRFAVDASHELRTPLAVLRARLELTLSRDRSPAEYRAAIKTALGAGIRLEEVVQSLLVLAKTDGGGIPFELVDLSLLVGRAVDALRPAFAEAGVRITTALPDGTVTVDGNPALLDRLVSDLVENALVHGGAGGEVEVQLAASAGRARLLVLDRGPGIAPELLPHVFERFARADASRARATGGAGLGLAIARSLARLHVGDVAIEARDGGGAQVCVTLTLARTGDRPAPRESAVDVMRSE